MFLHLKAIASSPAARDLAMDHEAKTDPVGEPHDLSDNVSGEMGLYINPDREKKLLRKLDLYIAPVLTLVFLAAYLDRANIGNAASAGMTEDLNMSAAQLGSMCPMTSRQIVVCC